MTYTPRQLQMLVDYYSKRREFPDAAFSSEQLAVRRMLLDKGLLPFAPKVKLLVHTVRAALRDWYIDFGDPVACSCGGASLNAVGQLPHDEILR